MQVPSRRCTRPVRPLHIDADGGQVFGRGEIAQRLVGTDRVVHRFPGPQLDLEGLERGLRVGELAVTLIRGNGKLTASLTSSAYRIATSSLPISLQLSVLVIDPDGQPVSGASVTFTLTVPGIPPVAKDAVTGADGRATFSTTLPKGVTTGNGIATAFVSTTQYGTTSGAKTINVVK